MHVVRIHVVYYKGFSVFELFYFLYLKYNFQNRISWFCLSEWIVKVKSTDESDEDVGMKQSMMLVLYLDCLALLDIFLANIIFDACIGLPFYLKFLNFEAKIKEKNYIFLLMRA